MRNRLYRADCKTVVEQLAEEGVSVDLIYLDPPFNSNRTYSMLFHHNGTTAQTKAYHDMWDFTDSTRQLVLDFRSELEKWELAESFKEFMRAWLKILEQGSSQDKKLLNYLMYMTQRLVRLRQILKPTGSIYFHCDPTASHYLKVIMDGVFGRENFRNEIIWKRTSAHNSAKRFGPIHDVLLFYTKSGKYTWNRAFQPYDEDYIEKTYRHEDEDGRRYRIGDLTGAGVRQGESGQPWGGHDPTAKGRHWAISRTFPGSKKVPESIMDALDYLDSIGRIYWPQRGKVPAFKRYLDDMPGLPVQDMVLDIPPEASEYQTKKPLALLKRIVSVSSNEGDIVLDPFCGCGSTVEAAQQLKRTWIGIDISGNAIDEVEAAIAKHGLYVDQDYELLEGSPDTMAEYKRLNAYDKQEWLIRRLNGLPNPKKSGDEGIDGDLNIHLGVDEDGRDKWGRVIFSVKTGKQRKPEHVRELIGTVKSEGADMGVLILDAEPTDSMEQAAKKAKTFKYQQKTDLPPKEYDKIQILTAYEIIEGAEIDCPPTMQAVKRYREAQEEMKV